MESNAFPLKYLKLGLEASLEESFSTPGVRRAVPASCASYIGGTLVEKGPLVSFVGISLCCIFCILFTWL